MFVLILRKRKAQPENVAVDARVAVATIRHSAVLRIAVPVAATVHAVRAR